MLGYLSLALLLAGATAAGATSGAQNLLFRWYMREVRRADIAEDPRDTVTTYPFA